MIDALAPIELGDGNLPIVNHSTMQTSHPKIWCGGDLAGVAETTVEAVNDGKTAAWYIHCYLEASIQKSGFDLKINSQSAGFARYNTTETSTLPHRNR